MWPILTEIICAHNAQKENWSRFIISILFCLWEGSEEEQLHKFIIVIVRRIHPVFFEVDSLFEVKRLLIF